MEGWLAGRAKRQNVHAPISIFEVLAGSWKRFQEDGNCRSLSYKEIAKELVAHVKDMGFTHIELLPVTEHPFGGSWGFQRVGMFDSDETLQHTERVLRTDPSSSPA